MSEITVVRMPGGFQRYDLVRAFFQLRKAVFIDEMDWPLYQYEEIEFEQYDTFHAVYLIAHDGGRVLGGARLIRTDWVTGTGKVRYSYMIRDACEGLLPDMPRGLCFEKPPTDPKVWELTRLATVPGTDVARDLLHATNRFLIQEGANRCLSSVPRHFFAWPRVWVIHPIGWVRRSRIRMAPSSHSVAMWWTTRTMVTCATLTSGYPADVLDPI